MLDNAYNKNSEVRKLENPGGTPAADNSNEAQTAVVKAGGGVGPETPRFVAPTHSGVDILKLLSELEDLIENTPKRFGMMFRFDDEKFHYLIMKIRANLPEEMKRASKLARDSERIVEETRENAERILTESREAALTEFESMKHQSVRLQDEARLESDKMRDLAQAQARQRVEAAEQEAARVREAGRVRGEEIVAAAREQAGEMVADSEIVRQAQAQAEDLMRQAEEEALAIRLGADDYARDVLGNLEGVLGKAVMQIQHGRAMLERPRG